MVRLIYVIMFLSMSCFSFAQSSDSSNSFQIVSSLESWPQYKRGYHDFLDFIHSQINVSDTLLQDSLKNIVYVSCIVDTLGNTSSHYILKGFSKELDKEALRVSKLIKFDKPAMQLGKPVRVKFIIPIEFKHTDVKVYKKKGCKK